MPCSHSKTAMFFMLIVLLLPLNIPAEDSLPRVLFDQGHNQRFLIEDAGELQLSKLAGLVRDRGARVNSTTAPLTDKTLQGVSALVISGPFASLQAAEVDAIVHFLERGGRVAMMLHIGQPLSALLNRLNIEHSNAVLHEGKHVIDTDLNFQIKDLASTPLFHGISHFSAYGAWALNPGDGATAIASTSGESWVDLNGDRSLSDGDARGPFALAVSGSRGAGAFVVFGDDAIFQNHYLDDSNSKLAANLGAWLVKH